MENQVALDEVVFGVIAERRTAADLEHRSDVLSRLLQVRDEDGHGLSDEELRDQLVTLLLAGPRDHGDRPRLDAARARP